MQSTVVDGVAMWSLWQQDRDLFFNSYFVESPAGNLLVDPLALSEQDAAQIDARGGVAWIAITNRDHEREARGAADRFGAKIAAGKQDADSLNVTVDRRLGDGDEICCATVIALDGLKTPGEFALHLRDRRTVVVGDALWGAPAGMLRMMADSKLADPVRAALSLRRVRALHPRHLLVGDGAPIFGDAYETLNACLEARDGVHTNRVNVDELRFIGDPAGDPPGYRSEWAEIGFVLGASRLGYAAARIPPGEAFCPSHWHTAEEELFVVWEGTPTLRTPAGETDLRPGDVVAFPTNARGAHKLRNDGASACIVLMVANTSDHDVCFYPDSDKVLVESTRSMVRASPTLDYYDGET
jgi:uncharacterized cupin superfamily protein/glyoxylase-like metal-dependent hydrolase (beta-lactamase superfamily II)